MVVSEALRAQNEKHAFEKAKEQELKRNIERAQQENKNIQNAIKQKERGKQALGKVIAERDVKVFEKEMKAAQVADGLNKIEAHRKKEREDPDSVELEHDACGGKSLVMQQRQKERNRKLEE